MRACVHVQVSVREKVGGALVRVREHGRVYARMYLYLCRCEQCMHDVDLNAVGDARWLPVLCSWATGLVPGVHERTCGKPVLLVHIADSRVLLVVCRLHNRAVATYELTKLDERGVGGESLFGLVGHAGIDWLMDGVVVIENPFSTGDWKALPAEVSHTSTFDVAYMVVNRPISILEAVAFTGLPHTRHRG